mmetsp:Transcript_118945/g.370513  ORF Transcript_118945/g.370513 Transcript_118945/m.370513 type:complete len:237 (-) Transcript_118945:833-1543(-)
MHRRPGSCVFDVQGPGARGLPAAAQPRAQAGKLEPQGQKAPRRGSRGRRYCHLRLGPSALQRDRQRHRPGRQRHHSGRLLQNRQRHGRQRHRCGRHFQHHQQPPVQCERAPSQASLGVNELAGRPEVLRLPSEHHPGTQPEEGPPPALVGAVRARPLPRLGELEGRALGEPAPGSAPAGQARRHPHGRAAKDALPGAPEERRRRRQAHGLRGGRVCQPRAGRQRCDLQHRRASLAL